MLLVSWGRARDAGPSPIIPLPLPLQLSTWGRGRGRLGVEVWVPSRRRGWWGCGCWQWPSPAAGGHPAARVRRCGAASVAPQPETLRARASATSSSTVGSGPGRGMKARGPSRGPFSPRLPWGARSWQRQGWGLQPASTCASPVAGCLPYRGFPESWDAFIANPSVAAPQILVSSLPHEGLYPAPKRPFPQSSLADECAVLYPAASFEILRSKKHRLFTPVSLIVYTKTP